MSTPIPMPLRAAAGLAAVAIDAARKLPSQLVGLPVLAVSTALQASLRAQQRYAELVARGDHLLGQLRPPMEGTPAWARFDDEPAAGSATARSAVRAGGVDWVTGAAGRAPSAFDSVPEPVAAGPLDEEAADVLGAAEEAADLADAELADPELADGAVADPARADSDIPRPVLGGPLADRSAAPHLAELADSELADTRLADAVPDASDLADEELADEERAESELADPGAAAGVEAPPGPAEPPSTQGGGPTDAELSAAAVADAALTAAARTEAAEPADFGADAEAVADALSEAADRPPVLRYDELSIPQLRGHLRTLDETALEQLVAYERAHADRAPYVTMLENRLATLRSR